MIGSHDTFTFLAPINPWFNCGERLWKTQYRDLDFQYSWGVRFFDIRVYWTGSYWRLCHGVVNFNHYAFQSLGQICQYIQSRYPEALYRIVLEKDCNQGLQQFIKECDYSLFAGVDNLWRCDVKFYKHWDGVCKNRDEKLFNRGFKFAFDLPWSGNCTELHGSVTKNNWWKVSLKKEAEQCNAKLFGNLTSEQIQYIKEDKTKLYLIDYSTLEYGRY